MDIRGFFKKRGNGSLSSKQANIGSQKKQKITSLVTDSTPKDSLESKKKQVKVKKVECDAECSRESNRTSISASEFFSSSGKDVEVVDSLKDNDITMVEANPKSPNDEKKPDSKPITFKEKMASSSIDLTKVKSKIDSRDFPLPATKKMITPKKLKEENKPKDEIVKVEKKESVKVNYDTEIKMSKVESSAKENLSKFQHVVPPQSSKLYSPSRSLLLSGLTFVLTGTSIYKLPSYLFS